jgi:hypothetical protein
MPEPEPFALPMQDQVRKRELDQKVADLTRRVLISDYQCRLDEFARAFRPLPSEIEYAERHGPESARSIIDMLAFDHAEAMLAESDRRAQKEAGK